MIKINLPDGNDIEVKKRSTVLDVAKEISNSLARASVCGVVDDSMVDLDYKLSDGENLEIITKDDERALEVLRHSTSHLMAQAVKNLYDDVKIAIGPSIDDGFYYDFDMAHRLSKEDFNKIEAEMNRIIKKNLEIRREKISKTEAVKLFKKRNEPYKIELINELEDDNISIYWQGDFVDLCRGPHLQSTGKINHFKLLSVAGAYWRGDENNKMLQRIYGTVFFKKTNLEKYIERQKQAKKRDHRKIGKEMDLFSIQSEYGPGLPFWHPNGAFIRRKIENFMVDELYKNGYSLVNTPHIGKLDLWKTSGHWDFYRDNMYSPMDIEGEDYIIKPMNCPFHILIYKNNSKSYRDLPIRMAEFGTVYRYERSGALHGLTRVRGFTQDDAHVFCTPDQLEDEIIKLIDFSLMVLETFGFEYELFLATKPEKYIGSDEDWELATENLKRALESKSLDYIPDPGEGVFYGPKIDIKIKDALQREWQLTTIQVDLNLPERFDMTYVGEDGEEHRPIMVHRALMGSFERFFGVLIEHFAGKFPVWLMPTQVMIIPISDDQIDYAKKVKGELEKENIRVKIDDRNENVGYKIREAHVEKKIPYMFIVGDNEIENETVSVRKRDGEDIGEKNIPEMIKKIKGVIKDKKITE